MEQRQRRREEVTQNRKAKRSTIVELKRRLSATVDEEPEERQEVEKQKGHKTRHHLLKEWKLRKDKSKTKEEPKPRPFLCSSYRPERPKYLVSIDNAVKSFAPQNFQFKPPTNLIHFNTGFDKKQATKHKENSSDKVQGRFTRLASSKQSQELIKKTSGRQTENGGPMTSTPAPKPNKNSKDPIKGRVTRLTSTKQPLEVDKPITVGQVENRKPATESKMNPPKKTVQKKVPAQVASVKMPNAPIKPSKEPGSFKNPPNRFTRAAREVSTQIPTPPEEKSLLPSLSSRITRSKANELAPAATSSINVEPESKETRHKTPILSKKVAGTNNHSARKRTGPAGLEEGPPPAKQSRPRKSFQQNDKPSSQTYNKEDTEEPVEKLPESMEFEDVESGQETAKFTPVIRGPRKSLRKKAPSEINASPQAIIEQHLSMRKSRKSLATRSSKKNVITEEKHHEVINLEDGDSPLSLNHFKTLASKSREELGRLIQYWDEAKTTWPDISEEALDLSLLAVGQARLMLKDKGRFKQFEDLVLEHELQKGDKIPTLEDLQGFWDMVNKSVVDVEEKFSDLTKLKSNNWIRKEEPLQPTDRIIKPRKQLKVISVKEGLAKTTKGRKSTGIRAFLKSQRVKAQSKNEDDVIPASTSPKVSEQQGNEVTGNRPRRSNWKVNEDDDKLVLNVPTPIETSSKEPEEAQVKDVKYFTELLEVHENRYLNLSSSWKNVKDKEPNIPEEAFELSLLAVGQAELLVKERFAQFRCLISDCEFKRGEKETTCRDLEGFWDMVFCQVLDVDKKFDQLENLRLADWVPPPPPEENVVVVPKKSRRISKKLNSKNVAKRKSNGLKSFITAQRLKKLSQEKDDDASQSSVNDELEGLPEEYLLPSTSSSRTPRPKVVVPLFLDSPVESPRDNANSRPSLPFSPPPNNDRRSLRPKTNVDADNLIAFLPDV